MSKTYKRLGIGYYRGTRGYRRAIIGGARKRAIPPDGWIEERTIGKMANRPWKYYWEFKDELSEEEMFHALKTRFKLKTWEINYMLSE